MKFSFLFSFTFKGEITITFASSPDSTMVPSLSVITLETFTSVGVPSSPSTSISGSLVRKKRSAKKSGRLAVGDFCAALLGVSFEFVVGGGCVVEGEDEDGGGGG